MKKTVISLLVLCLILIVKGCASDMDSLEKRARRDRQHFPDIVRSLPEGFISLDDATGRANGAFRVFFWSTNIVFQDSEMTTVFQTNVKDRDFIIIYSNAYYINESRFILIEEFSKNVLEQHPYRRAFPYEFQYAYQYEFFDASKL